MPEILTLTTPQAGPSVTTWAVTGFSIKPKGWLKVEYTSNTGQIVSWRYAVDVDGVTQAQVNTAISFINQGKFMSIQGKSLEKWLIEQAQAAGKIGAGAVTGAVD